MRPHANGNPWVWQSMRILGVNRAHTHSRIWLASIYCIAAMLLGCSTNESAPGVANQSADGNQTVEQKFEANRGFQMRPVAKFSGRVTVDGKPPQNDGKLFVVLTDPKHLDQNALGQLPQLYAVCDADGKFAFGTYDLKNRNDGVLAGKYVVTFVQLHKFIPRPAKGKRSPSLPVPEKRHGKIQYALPDELKNLYSDPDNNAKVPAFNLDLQPPGKDDYRFDLAVADKKPVAKAAPHAVTYMVLVE